MHKLTISLPQTNKTPQLIMLEQPLFLRIALFVLMFISLSINAPVSAQPPAPVKVVEVKNIMMSPVRKVPAVVAAKFITRINAETRGTLESIVDVGALVKKGMPVAELIDSQAQLRTNELSSEVRGAEARLDFLQSENKRLNELVAKNLISSSELQQNKTDMIAAQNQVKQSASRLQQYLDFVQKLNVVAPFDGVVLQQLAQPGELLSSGDEVLEFMQANTYEVVVNVPVKYKSQISNEAIWQVETVADIETQKRVIDLPISRYVPAARGQSRTIEVHLAVGPEHNLWPGEAVNVLVPIQQKQKAVVVPRDALVIRKSGAYVYTVVEGKSHQVDVMIGMAQADLIEVKGLLSEGDQVIIRGNERLNNNQAVNIIE